ncbi:MAG: HAD family hydrolase [Candidatus Dormibacteria bacterium]
MTLPRPLAICFDYGGTLVTIGYPEELLELAGEELLAGFGVALPAGRLVSGSFGPTVDQMVDRLVAEAHQRDPLREVEIVGLYQLALRQLLGRDLGRDQVEDACRVLQEPWGEAITVDTEVLPVLSGLRERGLLLGMLSNAPYPPSSMRRTMARQGLSAQFESIVLSSEIGWRKPAPEAFAALLSRLGVSPERAWFVGDEMDADLLGATAVGMTAVAAPGSPACGSHVPALRSWAELLALVDQSEDPAGP